MRKYLLLFVILRWFSKIKNTIVALKYCVKSENGSISTVYVYSQDINLESFLSCYYALGMETEFKYRIGCCDFSKNCVNYNWEYYKFN